MKIAIVVWDLTTSGGTQRQALELAHALLKLHHTVTIYAYACDRNKCYPDLTKKLDIKQVASELPAHTLPPRMGRLKTIVNEAYSQFHVMDNKVHELSDLIGTNYDVINYHDLYMGKVAYWHQKRDPRTPSVLMSNDVPFLKIREYNKLNPLRAKSPLGHVALKIRSLLFWLEERRTRKLLKCFRQIVVLDQRNQRLIRESLGLNSTIVRSGLDSSRFTPKFKKNNKVFSILGAGILFTWRRFEDVIEAAGILAKEGRKLALTIVGSEQFDPGYSKMLHETVNRLGLNGVVHFAGKVSDAELVRHYQDADVFVFPNHNQTWGLAVFEAMASGTPVIVSKTSGAHEVLKDNNTALLVDPLSPEQIAAKLRLAMDDSALRSRLAKNGYAFVKEHISWERYARDMQKVFEDALA